MQSSNLPSDIDPFPLTHQQGNEFCCGEWIPLLSAPRYLGVSSENVIIDKPYIKTPKKLIDKWGARLSKEKSPIIGINWQGNPAHEKKDSKGRSLPLETFAPILLNVDVSFLSLQKVPSNYYLGQHPLSFLYKQR